MTFKPDKLSKDAISAVKQIIGYRSTPMEDRPQVEDMFQTSFGKTLGSQVGEILDFAKRGQILLIILPLTKIMEKLQRFIQDGSYLRAVESSLSPKDIDKMKAFEVVMQDVDVGDTVDTVEEVIDQDDELWYLSLITFTVYAYVDVYSKSLIKSVTSNPLLMQKLETYLEREALQNKDDKERKYVTSVTDLSQYGVSRRLQTIERGLSIDRILSEVTNPDVLSIIRRSFIKIKETRNKIAHRDPKLKRDDYTYEMFEDISNAVEELDFTFNEIEETLGFLKPIFGTIEDLGKQTMDRIKRTMNIAYMTMLYPALIDVVVHDLMED